LIKGIPYKMHTVLTEPELFASRGKDAELERLCARHGIAHHIRHANYPWTDDQLRRVRLLLKASSERSARLRTRRDIEAQFQAFLSSYNFSRRLKKVGGLTPFEFICKAWQQTPAQFHADPRHHILKLKTNFGQPTLSAMLIDLGAEEARNARDRVYGQRAAATGGESV
jgi:hypothetical protein